MTTTEEILDFLEPEEIDDRILEFRQTIDFEKNEYRSLEELGRLFDFMRHLIYVREFEDAADALHKTRRHLEAALEDKPGDPDLLNLWIDWNELAMRFVLPEPDTFAEFPFYREIKETCAGRGPGFDLRLMQNQLGLLTHFQNWTSMGGETGKLEESVREEMVAMQESAIDEINQQLADWKSDGAYEELVSLKRSLLRYYSFSSQPKQAIAILKELLDDLPHHPEFTPTDLADINLEIGSIFLNYNKFKTAQPYLEEARDIYEEAGEAFEIHASQADALVQECLMNNPEE